LTSFRPSGEISQIGVIAKIKIVWQPTSVMSPIVDMTERINLMTLTGISARSAQASNKIPKAKETIKKMKQITKHSGTLYNLKFQLTLV
jgi:hypothetical protein